ncbi:MAG: AMP-binding protein, partial [Acidimicrobiia bacterium]|nr:AMP-binding protein [Acidimicrobiia bacterium]
MQRALWTSQRLSPDEPVQNTALLSRIRGPMDPERLAAAFSRVVTDHDVLRSRIVRRPDGDRVQLFDAGSGQRLSEIITTSPEELEILARGRCRTVLDMGRQGFDSLIAAHADGTCSWYLNLHHTITDATSSALVFAATAEAYFEIEQGSNRSHGAGGVAAKPSYYHWASERFGADSAPDRATLRARQHWAKRPTAPPIDRLYRTADQADDGEGPATASRLTLDVGRDLAAAIERRLQSDYGMLSADLAWTVLLVSALTIHLHRLSGADRFSIGLPVHNRSRPETRSLIGPVMEVFPVDVAVEGGDTFRTLHKRVGQAVVETLRNAAPGTSPQPDYAAIVNVIPRAEQTRFGPYEATTRWLHPGAIDRTNLIRLQMTGYANDSGAGVSGGPDFAIDLNHRAAGPDQRRRAPHHIGTVLRAMVAEPDAALESLALPTAEERRLLDRWGSSPALDRPAIDPPGSLMDRLFDRLDGTTDVVIADQGRRLTGPELRRWIDATTRSIDDKARPGSRVAIDLPRSMEAVVAIMATLASGRSFVPLDVSQPQERRRRLIARAACDLVLSSTAEIAGLQPEGQSHFGEPAANGGGTARRSRRPHPVDGGAEAYLLYTSGSTGEPKGVPITRQGLVDYLNFAIDAYVDNDRPVVAPLFSALTFDLTITTLFVPLLVGGRLIVIEDAGAAGLAAVAGHRDITWAKATPSHLEVLDRLLPADHRLATLIVGGEAFGSSLAKRLLRFNPEARIFNEYGPTEAVVGCMIHQVDPVWIERHHEVPIGRPAPGVTLAVVDHYLQPVPPGAVGELMIHHRGVTAGYLDGQDADPFVELEGKRFYRSGDLVRLEDEDHLIYLGRVDDQVKVGGRRLEPIEVEQALDEHPAISRSAVRLWSPSAAQPQQHCVRCGLPDNVPGVSFDRAGICETCHAYDAVAPVTRSWFKNPDDLRIELEKARSNRTGRYDVLHLLSGGKDSTYALYRLVELGAVPYAITLDNGFISEGAKDNVRRSVADLGIDHEFVTTEAMNQIFADSLATHSNVCNGCYKAIYTLATNRADELGIPLIVTGLSRGQLFETRLIPQQFDLDRFDPDAIDRAVLEARKIYHRTDDAANRLLDTTLFESDEVFSRIHYLDFYRYVDVELAELLDFLTNRAPWVRPADTGRSTNCLINSAGIHTHLTEQGYHNYAIPYAWDVRLGHKTRQQAIDELDDRLDLDEVSDMLATVG